MNYIGFIFFILESKQFIYPSSLSSYSHKTQMQKIHPMSLITLKNLMSYILVLV